MVRHGVKVAFYLDTQSLTAIAERAIQSVREAMPDAEIWHLTAIDGFELSADKKLFLDVKGEFAYRQAMVSAELTGDVLFLDVDCIVREDVSSVFEHDFDVCVTTDMRPGAEGIKYNGGVIFCRNPEYWKAIAEACKGLDFCKTSGDWEPIERARGAVADSGKFKLMVLDGETYNYVPSNASDLRGKIMHYRGNRKNWMIPIQGFESGLNTPMRLMIEQAAFNLRRNLPLFIEKKENAGTAIIVGGAPSLKDSIQDLRISKGQIFALNGAHDWLIERGVIPDYHVLLDARDDNVRFVQKPHKDVTYLIAAQCHPSIFDALKGHKVIVWTSCTDSPENDKKLAGHFPGLPIMMVGGGATVGLKTMNLAYLMGYRKFRMYGMDSSYKDGENHAYRQDLNDGESKMTIHAAGRDFICAPWMAKQAQEFQNQYRQLKGLGCRIKVIGDGLIPWIYQQLEA